MRKVSRPTGTSPDQIMGKILELCDATQQQTEAIADNYVIVSPPLPSRTMDFTNPITSDQVAAVLATLINDLKQRGAFRKRKND